MSHQKTYRRTTPSQNQKSGDEFQVDSKYHAGVSKLQELFPGWSEQDLQSVLVEVNNDVETAVTRISEGHAEQWGNVARKKDKKAPASSHNTPPFSPNGTPTPGRGGSGRGGLRGGRGGGFSARGGRGGGPTGRGASHRHADRERDRDANGSRANGTEKPSSASLNGTTVGGPSNTEVSTETQVEQPNGVESTEPPAVTTDNGLVTSEAPEKDAVPDKTLSSGRAAVPNGVTGQVASHTHQAPVSVKSAPAAQVRSWAQVARPQEKPKAAPSVLQPTATEEEPPQPQEPEPVPDIPLHDEQTGQGWEDPTTAQAPVWDDEPAQVSTPEPTAPVNATEDGWINGKEDIPQQVEQKPQIESVPPSVEHQPTPSLTTGSDLPSTVPSSIASPTPPPSSKPNTPRITNASRVANRFKTDQAVIMPSFGTVGSGISTIGMQFGSLSISGDEPDGPFEPPVLEPESKHAPAPPIAPTPENTSQPAPFVPANSIPSPAVLTQNQPVLAQSQPSETPALHPTVGTSTITPSTSTQPATLAATLATSSSGLFQPQQVQNPSSLHPQVAPPSSTQTSTPFSSFSPLGQATQPPTSLSQVQPQNSIPQHSYSQHGLPTHLDTPPVQQQSQPHQAAQNQHLGSYYRQQDYGFSPSNQSMLSQHSGVQQHGGQGGQQDQAGYNAFSNLGQNPMGNFSPGPDFGGYGEQRGFYEGGYGQQTGFGSRHFLGQDDLNKLPNTHQQHQPPQAQQPGSSISPPAGQPTPALSSQAQGSTQTSAGQGQQSYPPPVPYYYPHNPYYSQPNPYYTGPNPGYGLSQPFMNMKYPPIYQPGPPAPGPGTPSSTGGKGVNQNVPPATNSYGGHSGLYGQQHHQGGYDDGNYAPPPQHQSQPAGGGAEYGKPPLYGLSHNQTFLGQSAQSALSRHQQPASSSPENAYKHYGAQSTNPVGGAKSTDSVAGAAQNQHQHIRGAVQPNPGSVAGGFYSSGAAAANRFAAPGLPAPNGPAQQGQTNYPPAGGEGGNYYQYQRPQYW